MRVLRHQKLGLFIYECIRFIILMAAFVYLLSDNTAFPWLILAAPGALFPLMALFVWLDVSRFKAYLPLLMAGKCISIISLVGWSIITRRGTIMEDLNGFIFYLKFILLSGDFFAMAVILAVIKSVQKTEDE